MHTTVFSVSGLLPKLVPLLNAYLFFRSQNTCSSSFFTACQTLYRAPSASSPLKLVHYCLGFAGERIEAETG